MVLYIFLGVFQSIVDEVKPFRLEQEAEKAWSDYVQKDYALFKADNTLLCDTVHDGSTIYVLDLPDTDELRVSANGTTVTKIAVIEDGYVRDAQIYTGNPDDLDKEDFENHFTDLKNPCQYIGIFNGANDEDVLKKAAEHEGVHPGIITLIDPFREV